MSKKEAVFNNGWFVDHEDYLSKGFDATILRVIEGKWFDLDGTPAEKPSKPWPVRLVQR